MILRKMMWNKRYQMEQRSNEGNEGFFGDDGYGHYLDC